MEYRTSLEFYLQNFFFKLRILQNKSVKVIGGGSYYDRATLFYTKLGILKLTELVKFEKALFVFKFKLKSLPAQFSKYFCEISSVHNVKSLPGAVLPGQVRRIITSCLS